MFRRYAEPLSKLWFPSPSAEKPIRFMSSIVGVSPKNAEIGGVAPTESPAATVKSTLAGLARYRRTTASGTPSPPIAKDGFAAAPVTLSAGLGQRHELAVVVGDVEDRDLLVLPGPR